ncbi:hypothetical protein [uncultured Ferrovibrio sp.]|jgi:hypothetical protein|uniref:hypothetical protein n=1 Tax=uncultured Ferrovibrio sp. TaxID=1576913 RepID=UPI0026223235|nr:hypothetical protein [uncultured Ferrovibrio sp.]
MRQTMLTIEEQRKRAEARLARARAVRAAVERRLRQEIRRRDNSRKYLLGALLGDWIAASEQRLAAARNHIASQALRDIDYETLRGTPFEVTPVAKGDGNGETSA